MSDRNRLSAFEQAILPHFNAAYNLARWLTGHDQDARDVVQEAFLRAFRAFDGFYGTDGRAWLLAIVRNTAYSSIQKNKPIRSMALFDEEIHSDTRTETTNPRANLQLSEDAQRLQDGMENLPSEFREVLVLRHQEGMSYRKIAEVAGIPQGTVMSRLARARARLRECFPRPDTKEARW
ncbi:MAG TPA: sigma-70 family RNA polymerase sigma factor [Chthoniobacterales bacterium]|nr:sigma-70 family RNA polymerase sigma factor [Chthoniobacterales bacterium]